MGSVWKAGLLQERKAFARRRDPRLDKFAGPLELERGITWRSIFKYNFALLGLAGIIAFANERAYNKVRINSGSSAAPARHARDTKRLLADGAEESVEVKSKETLSELHDRVRRETNDWDPTKLRNVAIARPKEGLTMDNLRDAGGPSVEWSNDAQEKLKKMVENPRS